LFHFELESEGECKQVGVLFADLTYDTVVFQDASCFVALNHSAELLKFQKTLPLLLGALLLLFLGAGLFVDDLRCGDVCLVLGK
jgi:hypothetical protein